MYKIYLYAVKNKLILLCSNIKYTFARINKYLGANKHTVCLTLGNGHIFVEAVLQTPTSEAEGDLQ